MEKIKIILSTIVVGTGLVVAILYFTLPILSITVVPEESKIFINNQLYAEGSYRGRLKKDYYQIQITNEDYIDYRETVNLIENHSLDITLKLKEIANIVDTPVPHSLTLSESGTQSDHLLSIDRSTSNLIMIDGKKTTILHSEPVKIFDYIHPVVAIIEKNKPSSIIFMNIDTNKKQTITPDEPIIITDLSMSPISNDIFMLGNINTINRTNGLYKIKNSGENLVKITDTKATSIETLDERYLAEFAYADYNNSSTTSVLDTLSGKKIFHELGNSFSISPSNETLAVFNSEKIITFSNNSRSSKEYLVTGPYFAEWLDRERILIFINGRSGAETSLLNTKTGGQTLFKKLRELDGVYIKSVDGITKSNIYITSVSGALYDISRLSIEASQ